MDSSHALPDEKIHRSHLARYTLGLVLLAAFDDALFHHVQGKGLINLNGCPLII
jgi:hypothetical protein